MPRGCLVGPRWGPVWWGFRDVQDLMPLLVGSAVQRGVREVESAVGIHPGTGCRGGLTRILKRGST